MGENEARGIVIRNIAPVDENVLKQEQRLEREKWAQGRFTVETVGLKCGPKTLENELDTALAGGEIVREAIRAEREGCNAVTIDCFVDPCLDACRAAVTIPVVGMGQAAILTAASLGRRIGIVTVLDGTARQIERNVAKYGLSARVVFYGAIQIACCDLWTDSLRTQQTLRKECKRMLEERCDVIVLGCTGLEPFVAAFRDRLAAPILMPSCCGLELAYLLARLKISHSQAAHPHASFRHFRT